MVYPLRAGTIPRAAAALCAMAFRTGAVAAQQAPPRYTFGWADAVAVSGGAAISGIALLITPPPSSCAPCDRTSLPGIDRFAIDQHSHFAAIASDLLLLGVISGGTLAAVTGTGGARARGDAAVLANAAVWSFASTELLKQAVHRARPALYRSDATQAAADPNSRLGFPSGHTSVAFALTTAYATLAARQHLPHARRTTALLYAAATGVGALRVTAGRHFPTDVFAGAALGAAVGWIVARVHPTSP